MSGDIAFEPNLQRTISVDIRYVLFIIEKLMGGKNIVDELKFVHKSTKVDPTVIPVIDLPAPVVNPKSNKNSKKIK